MNDYSERYDINRIPLPDVESKKNAKALEEAFSYVQEHSDEIGLDPDGDYVEASFRNSCDSPEECEMFNPKEDSRER